MATTWLVPLHIGKGRTLSKAFKDITNYGMNPNKTDGGRLITVYQCDAETVATEFLLAKRQYHAITGREQKREHDVIMYHMEQSFAPDEITPEEANQVGQELAQALTKGKNAFLVCTHIDKSHIHNHIYINAVSLDYSRKFQNFKNSSWAVRRISDRICLEHGLSVIKEPKQSKGLKEKWEREKPVTFQEQLRWTIDDALAKKPKDFEDFIRTMEEMGYKAKRGKHLKFYVPGSKKGTRCDTLKGDYTDEAIRERIAGNRSVAPWPRRETTAAPLNNKFNLLIDIQTKIQQGKTKGYEKWAKGFNLKQAAKTLLFLQENDLTDYAELERQSTQSTSIYTDTQSRIRKLEAQLAENAKLQKQIINYTKTKDIYTAYRKAGYSKKFLAEHESDIHLHKAAKQAFDAFGEKKIPSIPSLRKEYAALLAEKNKLYASAKAQKKEAHELLTAKANVDLLLGKPSVLEKLEQAKQGVHRDEMNIKKEEPKR